MKVLRPIHRIIYVSQATTPLSADDLQSIFVTYRANNERLGITGVLLYESGHFLQVLEGDRHAVKASFERIRRDPRHTDVRTAVEDDITRRQFTRWSMVHCCPLKNDPAPRGTDRRFIEPGRASAPALAQDGAFIRRYQCMLDDFLPAVS